MTSVDCIPIKGWILTTLCGCMVQAAGQPASGAPVVTEVRDRPTPKVWIQQHFGVEFPSSARRFTLYYRSTDEDLTLFSFVIAKDDLERLLNGKGIFPKYADLVRGGAGVRSDIANDAGSRHFADKVAGLRNAVWTIKVRTEATQPREVQVWTAEVSVGTWEVCVSVITEKHADEFIAHTGFPRPAVPALVCSCVVMETYLTGKQETGIWQQWSLEAAGHRQFLQAMEAVPDATRYVGARAEALAGRLNARGPAMGLSWWQPSELATQHAEGADPVHGFWREKGDPSAALVIGRVDGLFRSYTYTRCQVLTPDPCDAIWGWLGLPLPASARNAYYASDSSMAGIVIWVRFDLPAPEVATCLAQTSSLPNYAEFTADATTQEFLETAYRTGAPRWWCPQELHEGLYALRSTNTKELADVCGGIGRLSPEIARVYVGAFSPW